MAIKCRGGLPSDTRLLYLRGLARHMQSEILAAYIISKLSYSNFPMEARIPVSDSYNYLAQKNSGWMNMEDESQEGASLVHAQVVFNPSRPSTNFFKIA